MREVGTVEKGRKKGLMTIPANKQMKLRRAPFTRTRALSKRNAIIGRWLLISVCGAISLIYLTRHMDYQFDFSLALKDERDSKVANPVLSAFAANDTMLNETQERRVTGPLDLKDIIWTEANFECIAWRQTSECSPIGPPDSRADQDCETRLEPSISGYCEIRHIPSNNTYKVLNKHCKTKHSRLRCSDALYLLNHSHQTSDASQQLPVASDIVETSYGIVMSLHSHDLPVAFAVLQHIRQKLNCELPIQLWIHETDFKSLSPETRGSYILQTITSNLKGVSLHVIPSRLEKSIKTYLAFQIYALANSQFHHVLMLSPNTLPLKDPTNLISSSEYLFFGTLLWPSFTPRSTLNDESLVWTLLAAPPAHPSLHVDTSAFLFDTLARRRELSFLSLYTREHMRMHAIGVAPEDLFGLAWARAGSGPTRLIPRFPGALGVRDEKHARFCGVSKVQFGEDGEALFVQREWSKGVLARWGAMQWFRAGEEALEARLEAFERGVDRDWTDQWFRGMVCLGAGKTDREDVLNDFMMDEVSDELRELELNHVAWVNEAMTLPVGKEDDGVSIKSLWSKIEAAAISGNFQLVPQFTEGNPIPFDDGACPTNEVLMTTDQVELAKNQWQTFLKKAPTEYPQNFFKGRGIVMTGGSHEHLAQAMVTLRILRHWGCHMPVELWLLERELPPQNVRAMIEDMGVRFRHTGELGAPSVNTWYQKVYLVKCLAILLSSFKEIIFLDADSIPLRDPTNLFSSSESYNRTGAVFWPDYWLSNTPPKYWDILGLPHNSGENRGTFESGQMLVDKERVWEGLLLAVGFNLQPSIHYYLPTVGSCGSGDKETFAMALLTLGIPYFKVPHACGIIGGYKPDGAYKGTVITQHEPDLKEPVVLFFHANNRKMTAKWFLEQPWIWQQEEVRKLVNFDLEWFALDTLVRFVCSEGYLDWVPDEGAFGECLQLRRRLAGAALGTEKRS